MCDRGSHLRALRVRGRKIHPAERSRLVRLPLTHRFFSLSGNAGSARKPYQKSTRTSLISNGLTSEIEPGCPKMDTMPGVSTGMCLLQKVTVPYHREGYLLIFSSPPKHVDHKDGCPYQNDDAWARRGSRRPALLNFDLAQVRRNERLFTRLARVAALSEFRLWRRWWIFGVTGRQGQQVEWMSAPTFSVSRNSS
jgi:hypothetical protein